MRISDWSSDVCSSDLSRTIYGYATYSRGFKGGGYNDQIGSFAPFGANLDAFAAAAAPTAPETADSYEAGVKTEFLDRRLRFNPPGFSVTYKDVPEQIVTALSVNGQTFHGSDERQGGKSGVGKGRTGGEAEQLKK